MFFLLTATLSAQNVTITGRSNKTNTLIRLFVYEDLINDYGILLDQGKTDEKGNFILEGKVNQVIPSRIYVGLECVDLILSPNATYDIEIIVPEQQETVSYFEKELPTVRVKRASDNGLYRQVIQSDEIINGYLIEHFNQIYRGRQTRYLDSIQNAISSAMPDLKSDYVKNHIRYRLAAIRLAISTDGGKKTINEYFDRQPVLYTQSAYIDLFKELFNNYFTSSGGNRQNLNAAFSESTKAFRESLKGDPLMHDNPQLAELIAIFNLQKLCYGEPSTSQRAKTHLNHIKAQTTHTQHKAIITNFFTKYNRLAVGAPATDFTLKDSGGKSVSLADYKDRLVLLQFVDNLSPVSERQFSELRDLHRQWQDSLQILTIASHEKIAAFKQFFEEKKQDWPLVDLGEQILLLETYNVRTFPEYILISRGNKIGAAPAPAPAPDGNLEKNARNLYGIKQ